MGLVGSGLRRFYVLEAVLVTVWCLLKLRAALAMLRHVVSGTST